MKNYLFAIATVTALSSFCLQRNIIVDSDYCFYKNGCDRFFAKDVTMKQLVKEQCDGICNFHMNGEGSAFYLFDRTHGKFCVLMLDSLKTTCAKEYKWIENLSEREIFMYSQLDATEIYYGLLGQIRRGWDEMQVASVWGVQIKVIYETDVSKAVEYEKNRTVIFEKGIVSSFVDMSK